MKHMLLFLFALLALPLPAFAGEPLEYKDGDVTLEGYWEPQRCAEMEGKPAPTVLIIHQWKGLGENEKMRAGMLADLCYNAFAIDVYGKGIRPETTEAAGAEAAKYKEDPALARKRVTAALDFIRQRVEVDPTKIAAIGYCFGGTMALELARSGADFEAAISFHGGLGTLDPASGPGEIRASVQVHHGIEDPYVPPGEVGTLVEEMKLAKADWVFLAYSGAVHAFTQKEAGDDISTGAAYSEKADKRSWDSATDFLAETLSRP